MRVEVFYCHKLMDTYFKPVDELTHSIVAAFDSEEFNIVGDKIDESFLDQIFTIMNMFDEGFGPARFDCRSMSVGDIIIIEDEMAFFCASVGWREVEMKPAADLSTRFIEKVAV